MKKYLGKCTTVLIATLFLGAGCISPSAGQQPTTTPESEITKDVQHTITYLVSNEETTKYCNGAVMDSAGYRKTITNEKTITAPAGGTEAELIKTTLNLATTGTCQTIINQMEFAVVNGTVTVPAVDGFAGVSIVMCSCKPQVEVNLLRMPGITSVVWE